MAHGPRPGHDGAHGIRRDGPDALRALHGNVGHQCLRHFLGHRAHASPLDEARVVPWRTLPQTRKEDSNMHKRTSTPGIPDTHQPAAATSASGGLSRRHFFRASAAGLMAGAIATGTPTGPTLAAAVQGSGSSRGGIRGRRILLKGGVVLSLDPQVGDFEKADVLIEGSKIVEIRPNLSVSAVVIDASNMIVMPGFVDTHRHIWEGILRSILPNGMLSDYAGQVCPQAWDKDSTRACAPGRIDHDRLVHTTCATLAQSASIIRRRGTRPITLTSYKL